jgi:hypothetical protein
LAVVDALALPVAVVVACATSIAGARQSMMVNLVFISPP